ncbi:cysteine desulfurase family protein [Lichenicola sp.]|uniref:cysteine desulfurase family protein n=1 Tax=Lichenicola sp. TaxID=2804529 RepID=UPI003B005D8D
MIYLDNQATTQCDPRVLEAMLPWFGVEYGNPHSAEHAMGQTAADAIEHARGQLAELLHADPRELVFTSGATESNNLAIKGAARHARRTGDPRRRIVTLVTEHPCVLGPVRDLAEEGFEPVMLPVGPDGRLDPQRLRDALAVPTLLVSVMAVNNETGVIQDLAALAPIVRAGGAMLHSDLAQAVGKLPLDMRALDLDLASISGHKFYGPKGIGALFVRRRPRVRLVPLLSGGGQERGLRSGTLPTPLVVGLGEAAQLAALELTKEAARIRALRDRVLARLQALIPGMMVNGSLEQRIPGNLNLRLPNRDALAVMAMAPGVCLSTGSACSAAEIQPSHVLSAMGLEPDQVARSLRLGIGRFTSADELDRAADMLASAHDGVAVPA